MNGKKIGTGDLNGACTVATALLNAEYGLINDDYTMREYNEIRHSILSQYSIDDVDYKDNIQDIEEYCFEDVSEYRLFTRLYGKVYWRKNDSTYLDLLKKASENIEKNDYSKAIDIYRKAFDSNPIAINARFELANALIQIDKYDDAETELNTLGHLLEKIEDTPDSSIARFYRLYGFILTEKGDLEIAYSTYKYSLLFQENGNAYDELTYIKKQEPNTDFYSIDYKQRVYDSHMIVFFPK